jgi:hypothetical protein
MIRPLRLKNPYSTCYVVADYTRFAYGESFYIIGYTIIAQYMLYAYNLDNSSWYLLSYVDGGVANSLGIDSVEFSQQSIDFNILRGELTTQKRGSKVVIIYYQNLDNDNLASELKIYRVDTGVEVASYTNLVSPSLYNYSFNYSGLGLNDSSMFKVVVSNTKIGGVVDTVTRYFTGSGNSGILNPMLALVMSVGICVTGLTFTVSKYTFSWFGLLMTLGGIIVLTFAVQVDYVIFAEALESIILVFVGVVMVKGGGQNIGTA